MHALHWTSRIVSTAALMLLSGCHSYYPYGSTGGYPGYYSAPPAGVVVPAQPYLGAPTTTPQYAPPAGVPQGQPTYSPSLDPSQPSSDAPPFYSPSDSTTTPSNENTVPEYTDPESSTPGFGDPEDLPPSADKPADWEDLSDELSKSGEVRSDSNVITADAEVDEFQQPIVQTSASSPEEPAALVVEAATPMNETAAQTEQRNPYAHDPEYKWLRGTVEYDEQDKAWRLMYNLKPAADDKLGGEAAIISGDQKVDGLKTGKVYLVAGHFDPQSLDSYSKPRYIVGHIEQLVPRQEPPQEPQPLPQ